MGVGNSIGVAGPAMEEEIRQAQFYLDAEEDTLALQAAAGVVARLRETPSEQNDEATHTLCAAALFVNICALIAQGKRKEANKIAEDELATFVAAKHKPSEARMLLAIAEANSQQRGRANKQKALEAASSAQQIFAALGDQRMDATAHIAIANIQIGNSSTSEALRSAQSARDLCRAVGDKRGEGLALHCLAVSHAKAGNEGDECMRAAKEAIACFQDAGLKHLQAFEHICIAKWTMEIEGRPAKALQLATRARDFCRACSSREHEALGLIIECYLVLADKDSSRAGSALMSAKAARAAQEGIDHFKATADKVGEAFAWRSMTMAQSRQGAEDAANTAESAALAFKAVGDTQHEIEMLQCASRLYHKNCRSDQAAMTAEMMLKLADDTHSKAAALEAAFNAYMQKQEFQHAKDTAKRMCTLLQQAKLRQKEGHAKLLLARAYWKSEDFSVGVSIGREAQALLHDAKDTLGEAKSLRLVAKIHFFAHEYEFAQRAALRAWELAHAFEDACAEGNAALLLANIRMQMLRVLDDRVTNEAFTTLFFETLDIARETGWIGRKHGSKQLVACSLMLKAQAYTVVGEIPDALKFADEAEKLSRHAEDDRSLAHIQLVQADAWYAGEVQTKANQCAKQALRLFQELQDAAGEEKALDTLERINPPAPVEIEWEEEDKPKKAPEMLMALKKPSMPTQVEAGVKYEKKQLSKVDMNNIDAGLLRSVLYDAIQEVVGEEIDLEDDIPLMQAGIASRQAVTLRYQLGDTLPGIQFPATIVFDYPTIASITDFIMDSV